MMKWNVYDSDGSWLGTIHGATAAEALENAKQLMPSANYVQERGLDGRAG